MLKHAFKSGTSVPQTGSYWVHHYQHRMSHLCYFNLGDRFPECAKCGRRVRFELAPDHQQQTEHFTCDGDFPKEAAAS